MKYYDGMGRDVTDYVNGLEKRIHELELLATSQTIPQTPTPEWNPTEDLLPSSGVVEQKTTKPVRRPKKVANTQ